MGAPIWDGVTRLESLTEDAAAIRQQLADSAKLYNWDAVLALLARQGDLINCTRLGGRSLYTVLHQAAHGGAPADVVEKLLALGAWRTLRNAERERPVDIAQRREQAQLVPLLEPVLQRDIPSDVLQSIQQHFHAVIRERAEQLVREHELRLPELEPLLEMSEPKMWFSVPGMYGGFHYWLDLIAGDAVLVAESWCRVVGGSGQRHLISRYGSLLIAEGFV
jgi:hypothetical protein